MNFVFTIFNMNFIFIILLITGGMLAAIMAFLEIGRRVGVRRLAQNPEIRNGVSALEGAVLALLGLLIAFTFSGAMSEIRWQAAIGCGGEQRYRNRVFAG